MRLGEYEVLGELGRGASARVFRARGPGGEVVAVKLLAGAAPHASFARFAREERLLASLGEPEGFVPLLATGISEQGPFFVMPLLEGGTLRARLANGTLGCEDTLQLGRRLATAVGWAHERGIVHRDLKPENILFTKDGRPLIADLGIAKHFNATTSQSDSITERGAFLGTPSYMAPEQMDCSKSVDARADVFALGAVLYECLTGRAPFEGETIHETVARVTKGHCERVEQVRKDTPLDLSHAIGVALNVDAALRYEDGFSFAHALGARLPQRARLQPTVQESPRRPKRRSPVLWLLPVIFLGVALLAGHQGPPQPSGGEAPVGTAVVTSTITAPGPKTKVPAAKGWFGEPMPPGLRLGEVRPVYVFDTKKGLELELVYVPPGEFFMGAINGGQQEKPLHMHLAPRGYYIGRTEVTRRQYGSFCRLANRTQPTPERPITDMHPMNFVSWYDATAFCEWSGVELPTEVEWEHAARGDDARQWPWGDEWPSHAANVLDVSDANTPTTSYTMPVGSFPNDVAPCGAVDMSGNVAEWCAEWFDPSIYLAYSNGRLDPPSSGRTRVLRGGQWDQGRFSATTTFRGYAAPEGSARHIGFRVVLRLGTTK